MHMPQVPKSHLYKLVEMEICFVCVHALRPSEQIFSQNVMISFLTGLNHY